MIKLETILHILKTDHNFREIIAHDKFYYHWPQDLAFSGISYNSQQLTEQDLFFVKGQNFKKDYLEAAISVGVTFYVSEIDYGVSIPVILVNDIKKAMSLVAMAFYDYPQKSLKLIAFTGTKGKTTAAYFAFNILKQSYKPAMLSTMNTTLDGGKTSFKSSLTTPESFELYDMMRQAVDNGCTHLIMEVSSQAYLMQRVYGLTFDIGIFLNITPDHISPIEHPTFEDYFYHKRQLLHHSKYVIINQQSDHFKLLKDETQHLPHDYYGKASDNPIIKSSATTFSTEGKLTEEFSIQLIGRFNQENALAAALSCFQLGLPTEEIKTGLATTTVPGRMEILTQKNQAKIFVDYAHNGDSLDKLINEVKYYQTGLIHLVIGATGDKGKSRRKDFATVINSYDNINVILTADDPNSEDPYEICLEIASHLKQKPSIITDRKEAIKTAINLTKSAQDAVILAGKGADTYQIVKGQKVPYEGDKNIAESYLNS